MMGHASENRKEAPLGCIMGSRLDVCIVAFARPGVVEPAAPDRCNVLCREMLNQTLTLCLERWMQ